jgi:hypothetical protein
MSQEMAEFTMAVVRLPLGDESGEHDRIVKEVRG